VTKRIKLDEHVGKIDADLWAERDDTCPCPVWLTDRDRFTILSYLTPFGYWPTRFVRPSFDELWETATDGEWAVYLDWFKTLIVKLTGGDPMACNQELATALNNIATALRTSGGGGSSGCYGNIADCFGRYTDSEFLDTAPPDVDPNGEVPPDGFDTMEEYLAWKCQAANWIHGWLVGFARGISGWGSFSVTVNTAGGLVAALLGAAGVIVFPPAAFVAVVAAIVALGALSLGAFVGGEILATYFETNKDDLVCALYASGSASDALLALSGFIEDAIQSAEFASFLGGMPGGTEGAIGAVFGAVETNSLVAPLFRLTADLAFPGADCSGCGQQSSTHGPWHFTLGLEDWDFTDESGSPSTVTGAWSDDPDPNDPSEGESPGALTNTATRSGNDCYGMWNVDFSDDPITIVEGVTFNFDVYPTGSTPQVRFRVVYDDETLSGAAWQVLTPDQWAFVALPLDAGKNAISARIEVSAGSDGVATFVIDNAGFWDATP